MLSILIIYGVVLWSTIGLVGWREKNEIRDYETNSLHIRTNHYLYIKDAVRCKNALREEIKKLKEQIPPCPPHSRIREWLNEDFRALYKRSTNITALENRLIKIDSGEFDVSGKPKTYPNPIVVLGPGELQHGDKIPQIFSKEIRPDLYKHLSAKKSYYREERNEFDVLYGVYYTEHILIADDMLATYGLFYDFITGKYHAEEITEQYYQDVVAIAINHEFREISAGITQEEVRYVEDAPTFTLSLSSGEHRKVTFVSKKYFREIREKLNVEEHDLDKIAWMGMSRVLCK